MTHPGPQAPAQRRAGACLHRYEDLVRRFGFRVTSRELLGR
jgi:hypothetical protein